MHPDALQPIATALTLGERPEANRLLQLYLVQHPQDESAWLWLSQIADRPVLGTESLVRALEIRTATAALPAGSLALAQRLRRLADAVEHPPRAPRTRLHGLLTWAGRAVLASVLVILALSIGPLALGYRPLIIMSGSMEPFFYTGSIVVAEPVVSAGLRVGDVIAYMPGANSPIPIVHRIVSLRDEEGTRYYTTRGDANPANDPNEVPLGPTAWRYRYAVPLVGYVVTFASSPNGKLVMIALPLLGLASLTVFDWLKRRPADLSPRPARLPLPAWLTPERFATQFSGMHRRVALIQPAKLMLLRLRDSRTLFAQLRPTLRPVLGRLTALLFVPALARLSAATSGLARLWLSAAPKMRALGQRVARVAQTILPALLEQSTAQYQTALQGPTARRALRELRELRVLLRMPAPTARRELQVLLRRSIQHELNGVRQLPALQSLLNRP